MGAVPRIILAEGRRFTDDLEIVGLTEQRTRALRHQRVILDERDPQRTGSRGGSSVLRPVTPSPPLGDPSGPPSEPNFYGKATPPHALKSQSIESSNRSRSSARSGG
jgi:hypothetical protein